MPSPEEIQRRDNGLRGHVNWREKPSRGDVFREMANGLEIGGLTIDGRDKVADFLDQPGKTASVCSIRK